MHCISLWIPKWHHQISTWLTPLPPPKKNRHRTSKNWGYLEIVTKQTLNQNGGFKKKTNIEPPFKKKDYSFGNPPSSKRPAGGGGVLPQYNWGCGLHWIPEFSLKDNFSKSFVGLGGEFKSLSTWWCLDFCFFSLAWMYWNDVLMMYRRSIGNLLMMNWCMIVLAMFVLNSWRLSKVLLLGLRGELASGFLYEQKKHLSLSLSPYIYIYIHFFFQTSPCVWILSWAFSQVSHHQRGGTPQGGRAARELVGPSSGQSGAPDPFGGHHGGRHGGLRVGRLGSKRKKNGEIPTGKPRWIKPFEKKRGTGYHVFFVNGLNVKGKFQEFCC